MYILTAGCLSSQLEVRIRKETEIGLVGAANLCGFNRKMATDSAAAVAAPSYLFSDSHWERKKEET